ncbi:hypothetical protein CDL15_Pgr001933 [Punica granatum]|uniref:Kinesin-like protein n=1 Tax=Punica granatum TaxID=22663 RepID=A0A218XCD4_PUNGR|nr:hypothetical protein CDL15_Pgr001933 [Punica granatum]
MDYDQSQSHMRSTLIPFSPAQPSKWKDPIATESRSLDAISGNKVVNEVNVQVILRCRPLNEDEMHAETPTVILCDEIKGEVSAVHQTTNKQRTYSFDGVFGPTDQQKELFQTISPIIEEVLEGYSCTIFAYGQTGTGKTYTMEGQKMGKSWELPSDAGIIPRAVQQIFHVLKSKDAEYSMKVTYLEIYNEEIVDLLCPNENLDFAVNEAKRSIILMEDSGGATFLRGLKQALIHSADEIYELFEKGSVKRRTAETLLNKQSSRSHSIFSVTVHVKDCTPEGEDLTKCGKLNLVDLAGSENIIRSGARELRAREAGEINKSLLTLGRVINALAEHSGHIPYRDSKLTRLLKDSLGGTAKTCIIATISPSIHCLDETLSTLDYASRAKTIKNRPKVNHRAIKSELIKDLYAEIGCLRKEVNALREKNSAYRSQDHYQNQENQMKEVPYHNKAIDQGDHSSVLLKDKYKENAKNKEKDALIRDLRSSEKALTEQILKLQKELENAASDVSSLSAKAEIHDRLLDENKTRFQNFHVQLSLKLEYLHKAVAASAEQQQQQMKLLDVKMQSLMSRRNEVSEELALQLRKIQDLYCYHIKYIGEIAGEIDRNFQSTCHKMTSEVSRGFSSFGDIFKEKLWEGISAIHELKDIIYSQEDKLTTFVQEQGEDFAVKERLQLIERVGELLESSDNRKKNMVFTGSINASEKYFQILKHIGKAELVAEQLENISKSASGLEDSAGSMTSIIENGIKANETISSRLASAILSGLKDANLAPHPVSTPESEC